MRAFRAAGRITMLVHVTLVIAAGLSLAAWWNQGKRAVVSITVVFLLIEALSAGQLRYAIQTAVARQNALIDAWTSAGNRPVLAFAPGFTNQAQPEQNLDAWAAALATRRATLNGFTGGAPSSHLPFLWSPTSQNAEGLMYYLKLPAAQVSIVTSLPDSVARSLGYEFFPQRSLQPLVGFQLQPFEWELFSSLEQFTYDDVEFYQFTPIAVVRFRIPPGVRGIEFLIGMRPGSYDNGGESDDFALSWKIVDATGGTLVQDQRIIDPGRHPEQRQFMTQTLPCHEPQRPQRELILVFGPGPSGSNAWDWPLIGRMRITREPGRHSSTSCSAKNPADGLPQGPIREIVSSSPLRLSRSNR
ncbi:MAG: hypothetical protein J6386_22005 [Candidatus Synoicihabitans palmerolidicus]|nr:hypothetical protein [Candidatus Synoicihabitans palmerolidicus]